jgi:hypothetical protein
MQISKFGISYLCVINTIEMYLINDLFDGLKSFFRKHNRGMVTPTEFNDAINYVQRKKIRESFNGLNIIKNKKKIGRVSSNDFDKEKYYKEIVRKLNKNSTLTYNGTDFDYPTDYSLCEAIYYNDREISELDDSNRIFLYHEDTIPTENYPVYLEHSDSIEVLPDTIEDSVVMYYYREPEKPNWTYEVVSGEALFDSSAVDFQDLELPYAIFDELLVELELYFSGQLKQPDVAQMMQHEVQKNEQLKNNE